MTMTQWADWLEKKMAESKDGTFYVYNDDARRMAMLMREAALQVDAIEAGGYDLSLCQCGKPVVCIPDGLPMCQECAEKEGAGQ